MELLSPAGNLSSAYAAFKGGADAIYVGGKSFSARASAENFSNDELKEITFFAHSIGRKIYVTVNTLLFQDEFFEAVEFAKFLYSIQVDGVIIQDLGLAHYLHQTLPDLPLNASTQLNCHSVEQAKALIKIGFKRIVLAREANLETIKAIKELGVEVEVFGHGALCVSYSGNCLMSSFIGGRSGNRGRCAQPCRMEYDLCENGKIVKENSFCISTKDLMTIDRISQLINLDVDSLKIEGRLKSNEYIYTVSKAYRNAIDRCVDNLPNNNAKDKEELIKTFNRKFTKGYIFDESPFELLNTNTSSHQGVLIGKVIKSHKNRISIQLSSKIHRLDGIRFNSKNQFGLTVEKMFLNGNPVEEAFKGEIIELVGIENAERYVGYDVIKTKDYLLTKEIESVLKESIKVPVECSFTAKIDQSISIKITFLDKEINVTGCKAQKAINSGTTTDRIIEQLGKSGTYPYVIKNPKIETENVFIPISEINKLRNEAFEELLKSFFAIKEVNAKEYITKSFNLKQDVITRAISENSIQKDICDQKEITTFIYGDNENNIENRIININHSFKKQNNIVHFFINADKRQNFIASQYCNITNSYALDCYYENGFNECILSLECDSSAIISMLNDYKVRHQSDPNVGLIIYGKVDMMIMKSCPIGTAFNNKNIHCQRCHFKNYELIDRVGAKYKLIGDSNCNVRVLSDRAIYLLDKLEEIRSLGINVGYLLFTDEDNEKTLSIVAQINNKKTNFIYEKYTRGHYIKRPL